MNRLRKIQRTAGTYQQVWDKVQQGYQPITIDPQQALNSLKSNGKLTAKNPLLTVYVKNDSGQVVVDPQDQIGEDYGSLNLENVKDAIDYANTLTKPDEYEVATKAILDATAKWPRLTAFTLDELKQESEIPDELFDYALKEGLARAYFSRGEEPDTFYYS